ncbi:hypothetical protein QAD02_017156 [Eretmocerus hayati]|uniref:Uncharacterized protein n=1 Tax=Eretmocerus hayati TaxID=131215 RepID=A0ACC2PCL4_9HYME|nr:hypothetical protein QAD02_017156 [Eretmocerus hayati]
MNVLLKYLKDPSRKTGEVGSARELSVLGLQMRHLAINAVSEALAWLCQIQTLRIRPQPRGLIKADRLGYFLVSDAASARRCDGVYEPLEPQPNVPPPTKFCG